MDADVPVNSYFTAPHMQEPFVVIFAIVLLIGSLVLLD